MSPGTQSWLITIMFVIISSLGAIELNFVTISKRLETKIYVEYGYIISLSNIFGFRLSNGNVCLLLSFERFFARVHVLRVINIFF